MNPTELLKGYDRTHLSVGVLGGHSALDVCAGAKAQGLRTVAVVEKGRDRTYATYYRMRDGRGSIGEIIRVKKFADVLESSIQEQLRKLNTIFVHSRYFWVYFEEPEKVEREFRLPIFGSRSLLKLEERDQPYNQYHLLRDAGIRTPKIYASPKDIDIGRVVIVKAREAQRRYERGFFLATASDFDVRAEEQVKRGLITEEGLKNAVIEEFIIGAPVNFNFFHSPLTRELELLGTDTRRQTNLDGFLRMIAPDQEWAAQFVPLKMVETGHIAVTVKESLLEKAFELGERFLKATRSTRCDPTGRGIIGPFALQGAVVTEEGREEIVIFDVSMRIPGSPGTAATPYTTYLYGRPMSIGERCALEIKRAADASRLEEIIT